MNLVKRTKGNFPAFGGVWDSLLNDEFFRLPENWNKMGSTMPSVNIQEDENSYHLEMAAPGKKKADFNIEVKDNVLSISSESRNSEEEVEEGKYTRKEFNYTSFLRSFTLPENTDHDGISAQYEDGILKVSIPKSVKQNGKKLIEVA